MGSELIDSFREYREKMNERLLAQDNRVIKRLYNLDKCFEHKVTTEEIMEIFAIANLIGGTIVIPHTRHALEYWEELKKTGV
jgi:hypothetical protein